MKRFTSLVLILQLLCPPSLWAAISFTGYWDLTESSGTRVDSVAGNNLTAHGDTGGPTGTTGPGSHNASHFTAANADYTDHADNATLSAGNIDFAVGACINITSKGTNRYFVSKNGTSQEYSLMFENTPNRFKFYINDFAKVATANNLGIPALSTWYFVLAWFDKTAATVNIQVNNGTVDSAAATTNFPPDSDGALVVGANTSATNFTDGSLFGVFIYKGLLTPTERTFLYNGGSCMTYAETQASGATPFVGRRRIGAMQKSSPLNYSKRVIWFKDSKRKDYFEMYKWAA